MKKKAIQVNVGIGMSLGPRYIRVGGKNLGYCENLSITIAEAEPKELVRLMNAQVIELVKADKGER